MKTVTTVVRVLLGIVIIHIALFATGAALVLTAYDIGGYFDYRDRTAFEEVTATVLDARPYDDRLYLTLELSEHTSFFDDFVLDGETYEIATANGLPTAIPEGAEVTLRAHPVYLGDGWCYPIASISVDGTEYLSFDEGYEAVLSAQFWAMIGAILRPSFWFFGGIALGCCVMGVRIRKKKRHPAEAPPSDTPTEAGYTL